MSTPPDHSPRPRVLQYITRLGLGGAETVALSIVRGLRDQVDFGVFAIRGIESSAIGRAMQQELAELRVPLFCGAKWPLKLGGMVFAGARAAQITGNFQPHVVHLHTEIPESAYATMAALRPRRATAGIVRTIHNSFYWHFWPQLGRWCEHRLKSSHVAGVSHDALRAFAVHRESSGAGQLPAPPVVIYNGVAAPGTAAPRLRDPRAPLRVIFAGRFEPQKGTDLIPQIIAQVRPPSPGAELTLYGHGRHRSLLLALAENPPAGWNVRVLPATSQLRECLNEFDLMIMPSRFEGLPLVAIEAFLAGVPVVATDAPGFREAVPPNYRWRAAAGDSTSFATCLKDAMAHPTAWHAEVAAAQHLARERFTPERMCADYRRIYAAAAVR